VLVSAVNTYAVPMFDLGSFPDWAQQPNITHCWGGGAILSSRWRQTVIFYTKSPCSNSAIFSTRPSSPTPPTAEEAAPSCLADAGRMSSFIWNPRIRLGPFPWLGQAAQRHPLLGRRCRLAQGRLYINRLWSRRVKLVYKKYMRFVCVNIERSPL